MITMIPVNSKAIRAIGYDGSTLLVEFHSGHIDSYPNTPPHVFEEFMQADSKGGYYNAYVKLPRR